MRTLSISELALVVETRGDRVCRNNGVTGVDHSRFSASGMRSAKVMAKALRAGSNG
jgi:hypothetical protein